MDSRVYQAHGRSVNNTRSPALPLRYPPNPHSNSSIHRSQLPPSAADNSTSRSLSRTAYPPAIQIERTSIQNDSSRQDTRDWKSKTVQFSRGTVDVLTKASEILQKSSKITIGAVSASNTPGYLSQSNLKTVQSQQITPTSGQTSNFSAKTSNVLGRADEILKRSAGYSREVANPTMNKISLFSEIPSKPKETAIIPVETRDRAVLEHTNIKPNLPIATKPPIDVENKTNSIFSRIDEALQRSLQITTNLNNAPKAESHLPAAKTDIVYTQNIPKLPEALRKNQYETPPPRPPIDPITSKEFVHHQEHSKPPLSYNKEKLNSHSYQNLERDSLTYQEAAQRDQERAHEKNVFRRSAEAEKSQEMNVRSSLVIDRRLNIGPNSPFPEPKKDFNESLTTKEIPPPAIHLPTRTKKPKFVEEDYEDGTVYKGEKIRDAKHGRGELWYPNGSRYEGEWEHDQKNGYGVQTFPNGNTEYDGEWKEDLYHGNGVLMNDNTQENRHFNHRDFYTLENHWVKYEGEFLNGKKHGLGTLTLVNNERYVGKFKNDKVHGAGVFHMTNGDTVSGEWENNKLVRV